MDEKNTSGKALLINIIIIGILSIGLSLWLAVNKTRELQHTLLLQHGTAFRKAIAIERFNLIDENNQPFTNKNLKGHWSLLFFGFTHCPMICPTTLSELSKTYHLLEKKGFNKLPNVVFISVDPERDSPNDLKKYVLTFNPHFHGATGEPAALQKFTNKLGILYARVKKSGEADYQINHSSIILIINPKGQWAGILTPPFEAQEMAKDIIKMITIQPGVRAPIFGKIEH